MKRPRKRNDPKDWERAFRKAMDNLMIVFEGIQAHGGFDAVMADWPREARQQWLDHMVEFSQRWQAIIDQLTGAP
jgi:hypothetical protein